MIRYFFIAAIIFTAISCGSKKFFEEVSSAHSGIHFNNLIEDNDTLNILDVENIYNGGGVGIADFNNDGLQDVYFTGNMVSNKLYLNKGDFRFEDITDAAGVHGEGKWCRGVSVVDINNDGLSDIYVSATILSDTVKRENILYINKGLDEQGVPSFTNMAAEYGLDDNSHSTMAAFFDYDNDGDLDMYLLVNEIVKQQFPNTFRPIITDGSHPNTDRLYRNDRNDSLQHPYFTNVSKEAGITFEGYGHGVNITDINKDGWKDIYVTNDFLSNNILYINNRNGTFTNEVTTYFKHTAENSMGQDVIDINNDGLDDVIELDMNPEDNFRKKMMLNPLNYQRYLNNDYYGYQYQYVRNTLQINQGQRILANDSLGPPVFSDIGFFAGIAETDWSWAPVVTDFDNDGHRDIIITNGFPKDVTDHDFIAYRNKASMLASTKEILEQIPQVKISNYAYKNKGDLSFENVTGKWGLDKATFSNGAAYADLDNDGDMDLVVNNINDEALLYRNNERELSDSVNHYLNIQLEGDSLNRRGLGAWIELYYDNRKMQVYEYTPYRGYLSTHHNIAHFGLGKVQSADSVIVKWPDGKMQLLKNVKAGQVLKIQKTDATLNYTWPYKAVAGNTLFREVTGSAGIRYIHKERDYIDFNIQKLLPHKLSEYGPALTAGDIDGNGLDDLVTGGSFFYMAQLFLQQADGKFIQKNLVGASDSAANKNAEDLGLLLFDADGDKDLDLYIASGGYEAKPQSDAYRDRFYINDGKGNFLHDSSALPQNLVSKSCIRAADFDKDGDLDLFVAGRVEPRHYPKPVSSFIYRNDTQKGKVKFTDITGTVAKSLLNRGLVCDAVFSDFDNDGWPDLVMAGEWMPLNFLKNNQGVFEDVTSLSGIQSQTGWWNSLAPGDFDNDGDIDYIAGNLGKNSYYRALDKYPVHITAKDFDNNGSYDAVPSLFLPASADQRAVKEFPAHLRDDMIKEMIGTRVKFPNYKSYALSALPDLLTEEQRKGAVRLSASFFQSAFVRNDGNGKFSLQPLPVQAQLSVINGMTAEDFDGDGNLDVVINGNDYGTEVPVGRYDALNGLFLKGDGKGNFKPLTIAESGIYIPGNGKALVMLQGTRKSCLLAASQNRGPLKILQLKKEYPCIRFQPSDVSAVIKYKNGTQQKREIAYGASFLSQSSRLMITTGNISDVEITDSRGSKRVIRY
ncbi:MAG: VCBS repeat-containing protein [Chitinophagaceae bacterium]|nr:VCBS repeat-containing protein [Chitinophagaceae bacterium]